MHMLLHASSFGRAVTPGVHVQLRIHTLLASPPVPASVYIFSVKTIIYVYTYLYTPVA
jgi:hypothetical protein